VARYPAGAWNQPDCFWRIFVEWNRRPMFNLLKTVIQFLLVSGLIMAIMWLAGQGCNHMRITV
jgi:hypothetical protein